MWSGGEETPSWRQFSTPPATWRKPPHPHLAAAAAMTMPETKKTEMPMSYSGVGGCRRDLFHVIHKVPSGDSPYVKAKHVQLIKKDPSKAVSLFWAAINAGDRVDSALKDMAVVMKQLNRPDEAVEAIKSFRHLCPDYSQDSLDNILVELYKRSGRMEEEIVMLQQKLQNMEEGIGLGGKRTKTSRSQGKKVHLTVEQEKSRMLGNLAWAYLQQHNYGLAEQHYRKAFYLEPDKNKKCNLAICLMHMERIPEAKSLLQEVRMASSAESFPMDESYAKSFERACQMLTELESMSAVRQTERDRSTQGDSLLLPAGGKAKETKCEMQSSYSDTFGAQSHFGTSRVGTPGSEECSTSRKNYVSPAALYTQPRRDSWSSNAGNQRRAAFGEDAVKRPATNMLSHAIRNLSRELDSTDEMSSAIPPKSVCNLPSPGGRGQGSSWRDIVQPDSRETRWKEYGQRDGSWRKPSMEDRTMVVERAGVSEATIDVKPENGMENSIGIISSSKHAGSKSWADTVEEEEQELSTRKELNPYNYEQGSNDENLDLNITRRLQAFNLTDGYDTPKAATSSRNPTVRRSLCFGAGEETSTMKRGRLQVFRDITPTPDSP